jgi:hypothetical protein
MREFQFRSNTRTHMTLSPPKKKFGPQNIIDLKVCMQPLTNHEIVKPFGSPYRLYKSPSRSKFKFKDSQQS